MTIVAPPDDITALRSLLRGTPSALLQTGDVILSYPRSVRLKHIVNCRAQGLLRGSWRSSPYSHAALVTDPFHVIDAIPDATLAMRPLADWLTHIDPARTTVLRLPPHVNARKRRVLRARMLRFYGRPYNPKFLPWLPIGARPRSFFCSEFVTAVYNRCLPARVRARAQFPIDLAIVLEAAGFTAMPLTTAVASSPPPSPPVEHGPDLFDRLGPLAGQAMDSMYDVTLAIAEARAAAFLSISVNVVSARMMAAMGRPGTGAMSLALVIDHYRALVGGRAAVAGSPRFEAVAAHAVSTRQLDDLLQVTVELAMSEATALGVLIQGLIDIRDGVGRFDPAAPDAELLRNLGGALTLYWRDRSDASLAFLEPGLDAMLEGLRDSLTVARPAGDHRLGALYDVLVALVPVLTVIRFAIVPWADTVRAAASARDAEAPPPREEVERIPDLWLWIADDRAPELDAAQAALAGALQTLAMMCPVDPSRSTP